MNRLKLGPAAFFLLAACTGLPFFGRPTAPSSGTETTLDAGSTSAQVPPRVMLEVQDIHYDGLVLSGRILVSPEEGQLRLDKRLLPTIDVNIDRVASCTPEQTVKVITADAVAPLARPEDLLVLTPGYWYGHTVRFRLFSEHFTGLGPECIEVELSLLSFDGLPVASQRIRAQRPLPQAMEGGIPEEAPPSPDAGSP